MAEVTMKGEKVHSIGELPPTGEPAPAFELVGADMEAVRSSDLAGRQVVLNIFPSVDTGTCALSVRRFNELAAGLEGTLVLCVSRDLPFAQKRFCGAEGIENVVMGSAFRSGFGDDYGVTLLDGPLEGLLARSVVVIAPDGTVRHTQQVAEISEEPDYDAAIAALDS